MKIPHSIKTIILAFIFGVSTGIAETDTAMIEFRKQRTWAISGEIGMNSLASLFGPVITYYPKPEIAIDGGVGFSSNGLRPGIRARYLFTAKEKSSFFGGIGLKHGLGTDGEKIKIEDPGSKLDVELIGEPATFIDLMLGVDFIANNGFIVIANTGYSALMGSNTYSLSSGTLTDKGKKAFDTVFGSGIMLSVSLGKAF